MSYILEALRKSERERQLGRAPSLPTVLTDQMPRRRRWLPWLLALLLALNGAALSYFWFSGRGKNPIATQPVAAGQTLRPADTTAIAEEKKRSDHPGSDQEVSRVAPASTPTALAKIDVPPVAADATQPVPEKLPDSAAKPGSPSMPKEAAASTSKPPTVRKPIRRPAPVESHEEIGADAEMPEDVGGSIDQEAPPPKEDIPPLATSSRPAATHEGTFNAEAEDQSIPLLSAMPEDFQQRVPVIKVNVLAYSPVPAERFAVIDMVKYNKGERLPWGAIVRDVRSDGLILELNGSRFRVPHR